MRKFGRKALALSLTIVLGASMVLAGCGKDEGGSAGGSANEIGVTTGLDPETEGEVSIMVWSVMENTMKISEIRTAKPERN